MRILQVIHDFVPRHVAGSELYCYYLSGALAERQHTVHAFFTEYDPARPQYSYRRWQLGALTCHEVVHSHEHASFAETYLNPHMDDRFERILDEERPDIVHLHHLMNHSMNYPAIAKRRGIPVVFTLHDYWLSCLNYGQRLHPSRGLCEEIDIARCADCVADSPIVPPFAAAIRRAVVRAQSWRPGTGRTAAAGQPRALAIAPRTKALYRRWVGRLTPAATRMAHAARRLETIRTACRSVDLFFSPSEFLARKMIDFGLPADRMVLSPNGMRTDLLQIEWRGPGTGTRFGYVGSVAPHKGVHVLVEAFSRFAAQRPGGAFELRIHGDCTRHPQYVARLRVMAGSAKVSFLGPFDNSHVNEVYRNIDVLAIPSIWWENAPLTLFEAKLAGRPVIVSDCGSLPDLIDARSMVFRNGDAGDLARCLARFADRPRLVATTSPHPSRVKSIAQDAARMAQLYQSLVESTGRDVDRTAAGDVHP